MYRVLLVDDEPWILKGLQQAFPWREHGFEVAGSYLDPTQALGHLLREPIDAVFTDIRMPEMDGITLMRRLREENKQAEVVIISGFSEFEYAQQALRLGAFDYVLKPIDIEVTKTLLPRLRTALDEKNEAMSRILLEWIVEADQNPDPSVLSLLPQESGGYQMMAFSREDKQAFFDLLSSMPGMRWIHFSMGQKRFAILSARGDAGEKIMEAAKGLTAGLSAWSQDVRAIPAMAQQASLALMQAFISGEGSVFLNRNRRPEEVLPFVKRAFTLLLDAQVTEFQSLMASLPQWFRQRGLTVPDLVYLWNQFVDQAQARFSERMQNSELNQVSEAQQLLQRFSSMEELSRYLCEELRDCAMTQTEEDAGRDGDTTFSRMIRFLNANYAQQVSLQDLARQHYINKTYACALFKKHLGITYTEYVNNVRIMKAKELLAQSSLSVMDISERIGYADCIYFSRLFKRAVGQTPSQYRRQPFMAAGDGK